MQRYEKTRSRATMKGEWYEVKVAALLSLRSKNSARVTQYQLATNLEGAGALDDIALRVKYKDDPDTWHTSFIQLKHKERATLGLNSFTGQKGDYSLIKYLDSFSQISKAQQNIGCKNRLFFDGPFGNFQFVIYTNSKVNPHSFTRSLIEPGSLEELLKSDCDNELIFKFNRERYKEVFEFLEEAEETRTDVAEFLEKLTVFSGQPSESDLDAIIKKELLIACSGQVSDPEPVYRIFEGLFKEWWRDSNIVLDETSDILQRAIDQLSAEAELTKQTEKCTLDLNFDENLWTSFNTGFSEGVSLLHVVTTRRYLRLSATKVLRLLHAERLSFTFISMDYLLQRQKKLITDWRDSFKDCLVIVCACDKIRVEEQIDSLSNDIKNVLKQKPKYKKTVLVSCKGCQLAMKLNDSNQDKSIELKTHKSIEDFSFELVHFDEACRKKIIGAKVSFQGHEVAFKTLYDRDTKFWELMLCDDFIEKLISPYLIPLGDKLPCIVAHYIPRRLKRNVLVSPNIFNPGNCKDPIVVSGVTLQVLKAQLGGENNIQLASQLGEAPDIQHDSDGRDSDSWILILDTDDYVKEFNSLCCQLKSTVHWLHMEDEVFSWKMSNGKMSTLKQFICETQPSIIQSESIMASDNRVNLFIAEPGMGKTTLMPCLAGGAKQANPTDWVIVINLRDHSELFNQSPQLNALDFLTFALHPDSPLEQGLLRVSLEETGNIILLLDSFDEISPRYEQEGCDLLTSILKTRVKKVVVTSRHCMQEKLENHLSTIAFNIVEFSVEDQHIFLSKFWSQSLTPMSPNQLEVFIAKLIDSVNAFDTDKRLLGIPLQTMMLAEVFNDHVTDPEHNKFPQKLDMINLFEQFVEKKFSIFFKKGINNLNKVDSRKKFFLEHMHAALKLLVHEDAIEHLITDDDIVPIAVSIKIHFKHIAEAKDNSGLVIGVINNTPIFLHRMFAEYLAALWFAEHFNSNRVFLKEHLFKPNYNEIRIMFDRILSKGHQLHEAVLDMDMVRVKSLLGFEGVDGVKRPDINSRDDGGRTALHLAAAVGFEFNYNVDYIHFYRINRKYSRTDCPKTRHMVELLIAYGAEVNLTDKVLEGNPLEYALETKTWDAMECLLGEKQADRSNLNKLCQEISYFICDGQARFTEPKYRYLLEGVLLYGFSNILELLFQQGLPVELHTEDGSTLLHLASYIGHVKCVNIMLSRGANKHVEDSKENNHNTPLHYASVFGHLPVVRALINQSSREYVDIRNGDLQSALHLAMTAEVCVYLIEHGADLWCRDKEKRTSLHTASRNGRLSVVKKLIELAGPTRDEKLKFINAQDSSGGSAIMQAIREGHADIVRYLIAHGTDVWSRDRDGRTCLHSARSGEIAQAIIDSFGDDKNNITQYIKIRDDRGVSALAEATSRFGHEEVVELLISHGADVWSRDKNGRTCLHSAKSGEVARAIIESVGDDEDKVTEYINIRNNEGVSALAAASKWGHEEVVELLISHGADVWSRDKWGKTCLSSVGKVEIARAIIESLGDDKDKVTEFISIRDNEGVSALTEASSRWGREQVVELLISHGADVWSRDDGGRTCLHSARSGEVAWTIIKRLGDDNDKVSKYINIQDNDGVSSLAAVSSVDRTDVVDLLISHGADVWSRDKDGRTCLHSTKSDVVARAILKCLADDKDEIGDYINTLDTKGVSALAQASRKGHEEVVNLLISHGADIWARDNHGKTSLHAAAEKCCLSIAQSLVNSLGDNKAAIAEYINIRDEYGRTAQDVATEITFPLRITNREGCRKFVDWLNVQSRQAETDTNTNK